MSRDCTGEPPGELIWIATAGAFLIPKARSIAVAQAASESPWRSGVTAPIVPVSRKTGIVVPFDPKSDGMRSESTVAPKIRMTRRCAARGHPGLRGAPNRTCGLSVVYADKVNKGGSAAACGAGCRQLATDRKSARWMREGPNMASDSHEPQI